MAAAPLSLKARALQWLAQREHSRVELRRKLLRLARQRAAAQAAEAQGAGGTGAWPTGPGPEPAAEREPTTEVDALLDWLQAKLFLSDVRFVESRINARAARYGNLRIRQELSQHGAVLDDGSAELLKQSELARAQAVWRRKYGNSPASSAPERARQMRFLAGRGFSADAIRRVVRGAHDADADGG
jgi:regulatory protein